MTSVVEIMKKVRRRRSLLKEAWPSLLKDITVRGEKEDFLINEKEDITEFVAETSATVNNISGVGYLVTYRLIVKVENAKRSELQQAVAEKMK